MRAQVENLHGLWRGPRMGAKATVVTTVTRHPEPHQLV